MPAEKPENNVVEMHLVAKGNVQGVGFRAMTLRIAEELELNGTVENLSDGTVEIYIQGPEKSLNDFIERIKKEKPSEKIEITSDTYPARTIRPRFIVKYS